MSPPPSVRAPDSAPSGERPSDPVTWVVAQLQTAWDREGAPPEPGFRLARPIVVLCGVVSLLLLAVATATILSLDTLWRFHEAAGFALMPVVAVKLAPIAVRAGAYYGGAALARLRRAPGPHGISPPVLIARLDAPLLVVSVAVLLVSGVVMWHTGDQRSAWSTVHNASAVVAGILVAVHLAFHARSTLAVGIHRLMAAGERPTGGAVPPAVVAASLMAGIVLAVATVPGASWNQGRGERQQGPQQPGAAPAGIVDAPASAPGAGSAP
jgi:hypothetical protein